MYKHLFFDDRYVFGRTNTNRSYGEAELLEDAVYRDEIASTAWPGAWVFDWIQENTGCCSKRARLTGTAL